MTAGRAVLAHIRTRRGEKTSDVKLVVDRVDGGPERSVFKVRCKTIDADGQGRPGSFVKLTGLEALTLASAIYRELGINRRESP